eukprot:CAMPEP_0172314296 /NCGR_PEP_ID=MMETSP1058-20130122/22186_1 /TAXON_ID=83371 /ORGANISM="Detonula confervacea, Strain CCMP 353" /LENGTH=301 /DNA_ID=CAMNT_0013028125 /DNA_START=25 /DNA_END=930 /DNA_ORIENTATION=+
MTISNSNFMPYLQYRKAEQSPTIPSKMIKSLSHSNRVQNTNDFLSAPKRKRGDSIDEISSSSRRQQCDDDDDDDDDDVFVYPLHKRSASSTRPLSSFCMLSHDSEHREGPADDGVLDDETQALVKTFRNSIYRQDPPSALSRSHSPLYKEDDDDEDDCCTIDLFPSIGRARTISDSDSTTGDSYEDPPDMADSRPVEEIVEQDDEDDHHHDWSSSSSSLEYNHRQEQDKDTIEDHGQEQDKDTIEESRERPIWLSSGLSSSSSSTAAAAPSEPSPLWNMSAPKTESFWPAGWTGMFHQGSA